MVKRKQAAPFSEEEKNITDELYEIDKEIKLIKYDCSLLSIVAYVLSCAFKLPFIVHSFPFWGTGEI